jgi:hypothetical protein
MLSVMFMDHFQLLFFAIILFIIGGFLFARLRHGSWTGAFLKGSVERTYGEVVIKGGFASSQVLKVVGLRGADDEFVGLVITAKAPLGVNMTPYRLSKVQAKELANLLTLAAK